SVREEFGFESVRVVRELRIQLGVEAPPADYVEDAAHHGSPARFCEKPGHQRHGRFPALCLFVNLLAAARGELVELRLAVALRDAPARLDAAPVLEAKEGWIQRALIQVEQALRHLLDPFRQAKPVLRTHRVQRPEHHEIERALEYFCCHSRGVYPS